MNVFSIAVRKSIRQASGFNPTSHLRSVNPGRITRFILAAAILASSLTAAPAETTTTQIVKAADAFLATLSPQQRKTVQFAFDDTGQRARWSNFPTSFVPRSGISLSRKGYRKVQQIMEGDEANKVAEMKRSASGDTGPPMGGGDGPPPGSGNGQHPGGGNGPPPGDRGIRPPMGDPSTLFGKDLYYISFLGTPSITTPWMLQFGGHHLALNITIDGEYGVLTPTLTGAQPALFTLNGKTVRPLGQESDKALALLNALDGAQRKQAVLSSRMADLVLGPGQDGKKLQPEGLKASSMNEHQRTMLLDLISEWAGIIHESAAARRMAGLKADINETWFSWSGPTTALPGKNIAAYYRIQGPHLVIEYAPQSLGGDASMHVHTMYRDPTDDYGERLVKK